MLLSSQFPGPELALFYCTNWRPLGLLHSPADVHDAGLMSQRRGAAKCLTLNVYVALRGPPCPHLHHQKLDQGASPDIRALSVPCPRPMPPSSMSASVTLGRGGSGRTYPVVGMCPVVVELSQGDVLRVARPVHPC